MELLRSGRMEIRLLYVEMRFTPAGDKVLTGRYISKANLKPERFIVPSTAIAERMLDDFETEPLGKFQVNAKEKVRRVTMSQEGDRFYKVLEITEYDGYH